MRLLEIFDVPDFRQRAHFCNGIGHLPKRALGNFPEQGDLIRPVRPLGCRQRAVNHVTRYHSCPALPSAFLPIVRGRLHSRFFASGNRPNEGNDLSSDLLPIAPFPALAQKMNRLLNLALRGAPS